MQKMVRIPEQTFFLRHTDGQQTHEKLLNITTYQGNANQNHSEVSPHCQIPSTAISSKWLSSMTTGIGEDVGKGNSCALLVGI